jgi:hypothetical protein
MTQITQLKHKHVHVQLFCFILFGPAVDNHTVISGETAADSRSSYTSEKNVLDMFVHMFIGEERERISLGISQF